MKKLIVLKSIVMLSLVLFLFIPQISHTTTYYVNRNHSSASDTNPGSLNLPWLTIHHSAETLAAGDTVYIRAGTYNEHVYLAQNGNASNYIVFSAFPGETPIIDGTGVTESQNGIIVDKSYIKLIGLEIRNWNDNGIWLENASNIEISDCVVHNVTYGIGAGNGTHDFELNRVVMHHFDLYGFDASPGGGADCYNGIFNDCVAHTGRDPGQNVDGFALGHGNQHDFTFNRCEAYGVYDGLDVGENAPGSQNNVILNRCLAYDCWNDGFKLTGQATMVNCLSYDNNNANAGIYWGYNPGTSVLRNCTFMDSRSYNVWIESSNDSLEMYNCIIAGSDNIGLGIEVRDASVYTGDYNLFHIDNGIRAISVGYEDEFSLSEIEAGNWTTYSGHDSHSLVAYTVSEIFVDPTTFDLHLLANSPAVDNGTSNGAPSEDFEGNSRPSGSGYDIGAYEYQGSVGVFDFKNYNDIPPTYILSQNYPNPFNPRTSIEYVIFQGAHLQHVTLNIYNLLGEKVRTLLNGQHRSGEFTVQWDGRDDEGAELPGGIYLYQLQVESSVETRKMLLIH